MCGGADGLVNFINSSVKDQDDALQFTEQVQTTVQQNFMIFKERR